MGNGNHAFTIIFIHEGAWKHAETTVYILGQFKLVYGSFGQMNMHIILNFCPEQLVLLSDLYTVVEAPTAF